MPVQRSGAGVCARRRSNFLLSRQEKVTKEKATLLRASPSLRYGATCDARSGGAPQNSLRAARSVQTTAASQCTKCVCPSAHARTPCPALLGTRRREPRERTSIRAIAALGPVSRAQAPRAAKARPSAAMARVDVRLSKPLLAAPAAGRLRGGTRVGARVLRDLTRRSCPSGARQRKASSTAHPATAPTQVCPFAQRRGRRLGVAFSLVTFFWRSKRKLLARRATPGLRPEHWHAVATTKSAFGKLSPNGRRKAKHYQNNS